MQKGFLRPTLTLAVLSAFGLMASQSSQAGGLEYTKQSIAPFFEAGSYAEVSYASVHPTIKGIDALGHPIDNMMEDFELPSAAVKVAPTTNSALAIIYERPFGVETKYPNGNMYKNALGSTEAHVSTDNITVLGGGKTANNIWLYGGVQVQKANAKISSANTTPTLVAPDTYVDVSQFYQAKAKNIDNAIAPVIGIGYEIPNLALRTSLTWRGETKHKSTFQESATAYIAEPTHIIAQPDIDATALAINFPQSVNLDVQTGIAKDTLLTVNGRWVNWKKFKVTTPFTLAKTKEPISYYSNDAYAIEVALGHQFTPKFSGEIRAGYDSGTGKPLSLIGPYNSTQTLALGAQYNLTPQLLVAGGVQYFKLQGGDIKTKIDGTIAKADNGDGYAIGVKVGYHF